MSPSSTVSASDYDPRRPDVCDDPYPFYAALRGEAPVHLVPGLGLYAVSRYADVVHVMRHPETFSSAAMRAAVTRPRDYEPGPAHPEDGPAAVSLIGLDGDDHARLRGIVNRGFTPARIAALEPRIQALAERLAEAFLPAGRCDFLADYAAPLATTAIAQLLGIEAGRIRDFKRWSDAMMIAVWETPDEAGTAEITRCMGEMGAYLDALFEERRRRPRADLVSALLEREAEGGALTLNEARVFVFTLLVAGSVTTTHLIANALRALLDHPEQLARLRADPRLLPGAVEETLRYESPGQLMLRTATRDVELAGVRIPEGAVVAPLLGSANRDGDVFPEPDRFDVTRGPKDHLAFGQGVHFCLGAALARLEARTALEVLLPRIREPALDGPSPWSRSLIFRGPERLHLRFAPARV